MKRALLFVVVVLLAIELVTRLVLFPASKDIVRFASYDAKAVALTKTHALRVAIVGNSAAEEGIDQARVEAVLTKSLGRPVRVEMFLADASEIVTWNAMLQRYFWSTDAKADVYVINYFTSLADRPQFEYLRVGMFFAPLSEWPYYLREQLNTFPQRMEFVLSSTWATFGARDRIRDRTLRVIVPGYEDLIGRLNSAPERTSIPSSRADEKKFSAFEMIVQGARQQGARLVVAAFPLRTSHYDLDPTVVAQAARGQVSLLDMRRTPGLSPSSYRDGIHLIPSGRTIYTEYFSAALAGALSAH